MNDNVAIKLQGVSKKYTIGKEKDGSLRGTLGSIFAKKSTKTDEFWALKDVSFEVQKGDVVGIIGRNGAGKSTLLKILSQITRPTDGKIEINGRIASLLEVGTGFHPELTGRENIFLNGTILGMTRKEVQFRFDEIVAFSGIEKFIDTPVKHYSSGMYVRLAFAVAAHLEPEILIIDEVLAVGDAEFQKKCLGKMKDVAGEGRTVLFVSHDLAAVKSLCTRGILLRNGKIDRVGNAIDTLSFYQNLFSKERDYSNNSIRKIENENIKLISFKISSSSVEDIIEIDSDILGEIVFENHRENINLSVSVLLFNSDNLLISESGFIVTSNNDSRKGFYTIKFTIPNNILNSDNYYFNILFGENQRIVLLEGDRIVSFEVLNSRMGSNSNRLPGILRIKFPFEYDFNETY